MGDNEKPVRWTFEEFEEIGSTNTYGRELLMQENLVDYHVITTLHQTAGRGRVVGRVWNDVPTESLLMTVLLRSIPEGLVSCAQYLFALALLHACRKAAPQAEIRMKWPNDLLANGRKLAGTLCEVVWSGPSVRGVVLGAGVNVRSTISSREPGAIALDDLGRRRILLPQLRGLVIVELERMIKGCTHEDILREAAREFEWLRSAPLDYFASENASPDVVQYEGLDADGRILLSAASGLTAYSTGSIRPKE